MREIEKMWDDVSVSLKSLKDLSDHSGEQEKHMEGVASPGFTPRGLPKNNLQSSINQYGELQRQISETHEGRRFLDDMGDLGTPNRYRIKAEHLKGDHYARRENWKQAMRVPLYQYYMDTRGLKHFASVADRKKTTDTEAHTLTSLTGLEGCRR